MSALIVQADDAAISHATTLGILDAIDAGAVQATGIFTNCDDSAFAAAALRDRAGVDVGLDLNFVTGRPVLSPRSVPGLVDDRGLFRTSSAIKAAHTRAGGAGAFWEFEDEPFDEEQVRAEAHAQLRRFVELFGRLPAYVHHHSLVTPTTDAALRDLAAEHSILAMDDLYRGGVLPLLPNDWYRPPFDLQTQAESDPLTRIGSLIQLICGVPLSVLITHPGYVDAALLDGSTYSIVRARDLQLLQDPRWREALTSAGVALTTYSAAGLA